MGVAAPPAARLGPAAAGLGLVGARAGHSVCVSRAERASGIEGAAGGEGEGGGIEVVMVRRHTRSTLSTCVNNQHSTQ